MGLIFFFWGGGANLNVEWSEIADRTAYLSADAIELYSVPLNRCYRWIRCACWTAYRRQPVGSNGAIRNWMLAICVLKGWRRALSIISCGTISAEYITHLYIFQLVIITIITIIVIITISIAITITVIIVVFIIHLLFHYWTLLTTCQWIFLNTK